MQELQGEMLFLGSERVMIVCPGKDVDELANSVGRGWKTVFSYLYRLLRRTDRVMENEWCGRGNLMSRHDVSSRCLEVRRGRPVHIARIERRTDDRTAVATRGGPAAGRPSRRSTVEEHRRFVLQSGKLAFGSVLDAL